MNLAMGPFASAVNDKKSTSSDKEQQIADLERRLDDVCRDVDALRDVLQAMKASIKHADLVSSGSDDVRQLAAMAVLDEARNTAPDVADDDDDSFDDVCSASPAQLVNERHADASERLKAAIMAAATSDDAFTDDENEEEHSAPAALPERLPTYVEPIELSDDDDDAAPKTKKRRRRAPAAAAAPAVRRRTRGAPSRVATASVVALQRRVAAARARAPCADIFVTLAVDECARVYEVTPSGERLQPRDGSEHAGARDIDETLREFVGDIAPAFLASPDDLALMCNQIAEAATIECDADDAADAAADDACDAAAGVAADDAFDDDSSDDDAGAAAVVDASNVFKSRTDAVDGAFLQRAHALLQLFDSAAAH